MVYSQCGSACPLTCENRNNPPKVCPDICVAGCTCPTGMAEYQGTCYNPDSCPITSKFHGRWGGCILAVTRMLHAIANALYLLFIFTTVVAANTTVATVPPPTTPPRPACYNGMVYSACGSACRATCANPNPQICTDNCIDGCFCPSGTVLHLGRCIQPSECPGTSNLMHLHIISDTLHTALIT